MAAKTSLVIVATTRSGLGATTPHGDITASYGTFGTSNEGFDLAYGQQRWGNFISANNMMSGRFLDGPEYQVFHDHGNEQNFFDRLDFKPNDADTISINLGFYAVLVPDAELVRRPDRVSMERTSGR